MIFEKIRWPYKDDTVFSLLAFAVLVVPLAFSLYSYENFESIKFGLFWGLTAWAGLLFFWRLRRRPAAILSFVPRAWLLLFLAVWTAAAAALAPDRLYAFFGFYYRFTSGLLFFGCLALFSFLLAATLDDGRLKFLLKLSLAAGVAVALISYLQSFGWIFYAGPEAGGLFRGPSLLGNINYSAMYLAAVLPLAVYFFGQSGKFWNRVYYAVAGFFCLLGLFLLASRGAILALLAAFILFWLLLLLRWGKRYLVWATLAALLALLLGLGSLAVARPGALSTIVTTADNNTVTRFYAWG
ncbi:MAG TPA: hypothetical protein VHA30_02900, partial [Patescibacteria group bacterium]|nr:hypothetical protein [Patescibacteria group bacterium]